MPEARDYFLCGNCHRPVWVGWHETVKTNSMLDPQDSHSFNPTIWPEHKPRWLQEAPLIAMTLESAARNPSGRCSCFPNSNRRTENRKAASITLLAIMTFCKESLQDSGFAWIPPTLAAAKITPSVAALERTSPQRFDHIGQPHRSATNRVHRSDFNLHDCRSAITMTDKQSVRFSDRHGVKINCRQQLVHRDPRRVRSVVLDPESP